MAGSLLHQLASDRASALSPRCPRSRLSRKRAAQPRRPPMAQCRWNGSPTIHGAATNRMRDSPGTLRARRSELGRIRTSYSMEYSSRRSLCLVVLLAHHRNEQIGDARTAHLTKRRQFLAVHTIEQQDAAAKHLPLVHRLERPRCSCLLRMHHHFQIARLKIVHLALEDDAAA